MKRKATIRDVAEQAGVSLATASRVINDSSYPVSAELRQRVQEAVARLDYVPNVTARTLRGGENRDVGLVLPNISNPFYLQTMLGINEVLAKNSCSMILCNTMRDPAQERIYLRQLYERQVRGVILSSEDKSAEIIKEYSRKGMKFVLLDQKIAGVENVGIQFDNCVGARMAVDHLISLGHRQIAFATLPLDRWSRKEIHRGYREALLAAGLLYNPNLTFIFEWPEATWVNVEDVELTAGRTIAERFLEEKCPATAILCVNDMVAMGVIQSLLRHKIRIPEDVSVFGFDDIPFSGVFMPALSTVHYPAAETGRLAALMMVDMLSENAAEISVSMNLTPRLVLRDTVAPPAYEPDA